MTYKVYTLRLAKSAFIALLFFAVSSLLTETTYAQQSGDCSDVYTPISSTIINHVNNTRPFYEMAMNETGVPWEMLAAIHYRETNFSRTNPNNGQGIFQFVNGEGGPYPPGPVSDAEFYRQLKFMADKLQNDYVWRNSPNPASVQIRKLVPNDNDFALIKNTFYSYNGRASVYADQAQYYGYNRSTQPFEGSPYVMNRFDCQRSRMGIITRDYGSMDGVDTRYGTFTLFIRLKSETLWKDIQGPYLAQPLEQSSYPTIKVGDTAPGYAKFRNVGNATWYDDFSAASVGKNPVRLGTDMPLNRTGDLSSNWPLSNRLAIGFARVTKTDGTLSQNQHIALPGETVEFWFSFKAQLNTPPKTHIEGFRPIVEGYGPMNNTGSYIGVTVLPLSYQAQAVGQSPYPSIRQGTRTKVNFSYKNTGSDPWYDSISAASANRPVTKLGTDYPLNRVSVFANDSWGGGEARPSVEFNSVYLSGGVSPSGNQHVVMPGEIAKFEFEVSSSTDLSPGTYNEGFRPIVEGYGPMNDTGTYIGINVGQAIFSAQPVGQSNYQTLRKGESSTIFLRYRNTGNMNWYDSTSFYSVRQNPVRLGTDYPLNRNSIFGNTWAFASRPGYQFNKLFDTNGVEISNNHIVLPGQIVEFSFILTATSNAPNGYYTEGFRPIVEWLGPMNDTGTFMGVTVTN